MIELNSQPSSWEDDPDRSVPMFTRAELAVIWTALQQYVDNSDEERPAESAAHTALDKLDCLFADVDLTGSEMLGYSRRLGEPP